MEDSLHWFRWYQKRISKAGLDDLTQTRDSLHFRLFTERQAIDIWTSDYQTFDGTLTNFTRRVDEHKDRRKGNSDGYYNETIKLDTIKAREIFELFQSRAILYMPPQDSISGWGSGLDGITYSVEYSTPGYYSIKNYWTPGVYKDIVDDAGKFYAVLKQLEKIMNLNSTFYKFIKTLPKGTYTAGGIALITTSKVRKNRK